MLMRFGLWLCRQSTKWQPRKAELSHSPNTTMEGSDPCQLFLDALDSTGTQIDELLDQLQALAELMAEQAEALATCRLENPSDPPPPPGP